jgi:hypothetical protein
LFISQISRIKDSFVHPARLAGAPEQRLSNPQNYFSDTLLQY